VSCSRIGGSVYYTRLGGWAYKNTGLLEYSNPRLIVSGYSRGSRGRGGTVIPFFYIISIGEFYSSHCSYGIAPIPSIWKDRKIVSR
jgi:hypothetical protein